MNVFTVNIIRFVLLLFMQVIFFSNIHVHPLIDIYVYPLFILLLPFNTPKWLLMLLSLLMGLSVDFFLGSLGMHAAAAVLLGFLRPNLINIITPKGAEFEVTPNIFLQGLGWFTTYLGVSYAVVLSVYLLIEAGTFYNLFWWLLKFLCTTVFSVFVSLLLLYLVTPDKRRRHA